MTSQLLAIVIWSGAAWLSAGTQSSEAEPVRVSTPIVTELARYGTLSFDLTNTSSKTIAGCSVLTKILNQSRTEYGYSWVDLAGIGAMNPGRVLPVELHIGKAEAQGLTDSNIQISVDFVVFEDKTSWGPDVQKLGRAIKAEISGARAERKRLKMLLNQYGPERVAEELRRPGPAGAAW